VEETKQPEGDLAKDLAPLMDVFASNAAEEWEEELAHAIKQAGKSIASWLHMKSSVANAN